MVEVGETAPDFTAPLANGEIEQFTLRERLPTEAPVVLAFFPAAFSSTCSHEMATFRDRIERFERAGTLYGVSVDLPYTLNAFREDLDLPFGLISDANREIVEKYGVTTAFEDIGLRSLAKRAVFVVGEDGTVAYAWVSDDPGREPDYDAVEAAVEAAG